MLVRKIVSRSPRGIYEVDYPELKAGRIIVTERELRRAERLDNKFVQGVICDRYAASIGREGADVRWSVLRQHLTLIGRPEHTSPRVAV